MKPDSIDPTIHRRLLPITLPWCSTLLLLSLLIPSWAAAGQFNVCHPPDPEDPAQRSYIWVCACGKDATGEDAQMYCDGLHQPSCSGGNCLYPPSGNLEDIGYYECCATGLLCNGSDPFAILGGTETCDEPWADCTVNERCQSPTDYCQEGTCAGSVSDINQNGEYSSPETHCEYEAERDCSDENEGDDETCTPDSPRGGATHIGNPVVLGSRTTRHDSTDVVIPGVLRNLEFKRSYVTTEKKWALGKSLLDDNGDSIPTPFGNSPAYPKSLHWWHNFYSFIYPHATLPSSSSETWQVREGSGKLLDFIGCQRSPSSCLAHPAPSSGETEGRLLWESTGSSSGYFVLHKPGIGRFIYASIWQSSGSSTDTRYFLTRIEDEKQLTPSGQVRVLATLTYAAPLGLLCPGLSAGPNSGVPYLASVESTEGTRLRFEYKSVSSGAPSQPAQCVLSQVLVDSSASPAPATPVVSYNYTKNDAGVEIAGLIESAPLHHEGKGTDSYTYPNFQTGNGQWTRRIDGAVITSHVTQNRRVSQGSSSRRGKRGSGSVSFIGPMSFLEPCDILSSPACVKRKSEAAYLYGYTGDGNIFSPLGGYLHSFEMEKTTFAESWRVRTVARPCPEASSCTQTQEFVWHQFDTGPAVVRAEKDFEDNWTVREWEGPADGGVGGYAELKRVHIGAEDRDGGSALETVSFDYTDAMAGTGSVVGERMRTEERQDSILSPSGEVVTRYAHDPATNRLKSVIRSGYSQGLQGSTWDATPVLKHVATFYLTRHACTGSSVDDPLGRVLEIQGPCWVDGPTATSCSTSLNSQVPVAQYHYWPASASGYNAHRLQKVVRFASTTGSASCTGHTGLETAYSNYNLWGQPQLVVDPNGVQTSYTYEQERVTSITTQGATWNYSYDNGELTLVQSPRGDYELFCYRDNSGATNTCTGNWYDGLRSRSKIPFLGGIPYESIRYSKGDDGLPREATYVVRYGGQGLERRAQYTQANLDGMPAYTRIGGSYESQQSHYVKPQLFDGAQRLVGAGAPYASPPVSCGRLGTDGRPVSPLCMAFSYDRANRLTGTEQYPNIGSRTDGVRACFAYDGQGNVRSVRTGCPAASGSVGDCSACTQPESLYQYDDFGNIIEVVLPWQGGSGKTRFSYDAMGQLRAKQTPQMALGMEYLSYAYDSIGRPLSSARIVTGANAVTEVLYTLGYDASEAPDASCPQPQNTQGRLRFRNDSFGQTWYSYDAHGRVTREIRARRSSTNTFTCPVDNPGNTLHTTYGYSAAGDLTSIEYPYGHRAIYQYRLHEGTSISSDRVSDIRLERWSGSAWTLLASISNIEWEPYGDVRGYQINAPSSAQPVAVDYSYSSSTETAPASCAVTAEGWPGTWDFSGRVRSLFVSTGSLALNQGSGNLYKRFYTWKADQIVRTDTCLLGATTPVTEQFTYDGLLRLTSATRPIGNFAATGGAFSSRGYTYDGRGNRLTEEVDGQTLSLTHGTGAFVDRLSTRTGTGTSSALNLGYTHDADGRVTVKRWGPLSGTPTHQVEFSSGPSANGGNETVFRSVQVNGSTYEYFYDALNRRRLKRYPSTVEDEFFHDISNRLLIDRGNPSAIPPSGGYDHYVDDTYVWLGQRPVMVVRGRLSPQMNRETGSSVDCARNGEAATCGVYFPVTDMMGKTLVMLDASGKVSGAADYDPFGYVNRVTQSAETSHPYLPSTNSTLATFSQATTSSLVSTRFRALFGEVDIKDSADTVTLVDVGTGLPQGPAISQPESGRVWSHWAQSSTPALRVQFVSDAHPSICGTCDLNQAPCNIKCGSANGVTLEGYEYQRFQSGATPFWIPLRFPGQYHDVETDLFENWNRYLDPYTGKYLQPEPILTKRATLRPTYSYALGNPIRHIDSSGLDVEVYCEWINQPIPGGLGRHCYIRAYENMSGGYDVTLEIWGPPNASTGDPDYPFETWGNRGRPKEIPYAHAPNRINLPGTLKIPVDNQYHAVEDCALESFRTEAARLPEYNGLGPNSNTFVLDILAGCGLSAELSWNAPYDGAFSSLTLSELLSLGSTSVSP
ncbi:RHS repeat-associated core domain-containing protein [Myxococcus fulvus]|uniref:RHS repeat-associated core domain-containing protein n=1 Tax=Myxococcus fulvus TaxID=33 RepID=UPI0020BE5CA4|nr:RHS repeat-associated core domain-containing protein [Myxococcus fulvus]